ncbi:hypothetical protein [Streptosporangium sp. KLBMP 9127]|nr:hypothetical protein [Streptosporangium sp. KLBMP 9127]
MATSRVMASGALALGRLAVAFPAEANQTVRKVLPQVVAGFTGSRA